jgi:predicted transposase/invertase (TIGR01784 family)
MQRVQFGDTDDLIDICLDNVFKAVFTKNTPESQGALSRLLSAIIGKELSVLTISANEPPIDSIRDRQIRFDINCKAENGELVNVEMSLNPDVFEPIRLEYHAGKLFTAQDIRGAEKTFDDLKEAYQVAFLAKERFFPDDEFFHNFEYYDPTRRISLNGRSRIITLELSKLNNIVEKPTGEMSAPEHWAVFFRYLTDKTKRQKINEIVDYEEGIAMASQVLMSISKDEVERARLMSEYKYVVDTQSKVVQAKREGRKEGEQKKANEIAGNLKTLNIPQEQIQKATGLSPDEIAKL